jgi:bla regulator protein blaR1
MNWMDSLLVQQLGLTLLHFIWQGALIGLLYAGLLQLTRHAQARTRYNLAVVTLAALAIAPPLTFTYLAIQTLGGVPASPGSGADMLVMTAQSAASATHVAGYWLYWVVGAWLAGVLVFGSRMVIGWRYLTRLRRTADRAAADHLHPVMRQVADKLGILRDIGLAVSSRIDSPVVIGWFKPLVLLPPSIIAGLPARQLEMVLAHELAHIRRFDHLVNLFQAIVETLLFYHPVVRWVSRRIRIERENACDDLAVAVTDNRLAYVEMLATLEKLRRPAPQLVLALNDGQILSRIRRLVEQGRTDRQYGLTVPGLLVVTLLAAATGIGLMPGSDENEPGDTPTTSTANSASAIEPLEPTERVETASARETRIDDVAPLPESMAVSESDAGPLNPPEAPSVIDAVDPADETAPGSSDPVAEPIPEPPAGSEAETAAASGAESGGEASIEPPVEPLPESAMPESRAESVAEQVIETPAGQPAIDNEDALIALPEAQSDSPQPAGESDSAREQDIAELAATENRLALAAVPENSPAADEPLRPERTRPQPEPLTGGEVIRQVAPQYPPRARQRRASGLVKVEFLVNENGEVSQVDVVQERPRGMDFGDAAAAAVSMWEFEPYRRGEEVISRRVRMEVDFDLADVDDCLETLGTRISRC